MTAKKTMGDFLASELQRIFPEHANVAMELIGDLCPQMLQEPLRTELKPAARLLAMTVITGIVEKLANALLDSTLEKVKLQKTWTVH